MDRRRLAPQLHVLDRERREPRAGAPEELGVQRDGVGLVLLGQSCAKVCRRDAQHRRGHNSAVGH